MRWILKLKNAKDCPRQTAPSPLPTVGFELLSRQLLLFICTPAGTTGGESERFLQAEQREPQEHQECRHSPGEKQPGNLVHCWGHEGTRTSRRQFVDQARPFYHLFCRVARVEVRVQVHFCGIMVAVRGACFEMDRADSEGAIVAEDDIDALHCLLHSVSLKHLKTKERPMRTTITVLFQDWHTVSSMCRFP